MKKIQLNENYYLTLCLSIDAGAMNAFNFDANYDWVVKTAIGERIEIQRVDRQGVREPARWTSVQMNEPTSRTHSYENYSYLR